MGRQIGRTATGIAAAAAIAALTVGAPPSGASAATLPSFAGSCQLSGTETFVPALTITARPTRAVVTATGRCSGTVVGSDGSARSVSEAAATYRQDLTAASGSCIGAALSGSGTMTVAGQALPFRLTEPQVTAAAAMHFTAPAWSAFGIAYLTPSPEVVATALSCVGTGVSRIPVTISLQASARST